MNKYNDFLSQINVDKNTKENESKNLEERQISNEMIEQVSGGGFEIFLKITIPF